MMTHYQSKQSVKATVCVAVALMCFLTSIAYAAKGIMQNKKLSLQEAKRYEIAGTQEIPIEMNEFTLGKLNYFVGTSEGREWAKGTLARLPQYQKMILDKIQTHGVPEELLAIAMLESGMVNFPQQAPRPGAGLWAFIPKTAEAYGLKVENGVDERIDAEKETDAAIQYLKDLHIQFKDWRLAIKAYNEGEERIQSLIEKYHTRDPWVLVQKSNQNEYLGSAIAMMIVLKNPQLVTLDLAH